MTAGEVRLIVDGELVEAVPGKRRGRHRHRAACGATADTSTADWQTVRSSTLRAAPRDQGIAWLSWSHGGIDDMRDDRVKTEIASDREP